MGKRQAITRREFMKDSALGGAGLLVPGRAPKPPVGSNPPASALIENALLRIEVSAKTGDITSLYHKRTGKEYIAARPWARAFRLNVPYLPRVTGYNADWSANSLDSWQQTQAEITRSEDADGQTIVVHYPTLQSEVGKFEIELSYRIHLPNHSDEATLQLDLSNRSPYRVKEVFFPWISGVGEIEGEQTDTYVAADEMKTVAQFRKQREFDNWEEYPYLLGMPWWGGGYVLSMPWMNYGSKHEGLYLASLAREVIRHMLMVQDFGGEGKPILAFAWAFPAYIEPGRSWRSPEIVLSLHAGDWHVAADKYRATLDGWYQKPDTPAEFKKSFASFNSFFTQRDFMQIVDLAEDIRKYGLRDLVMWNFGDYYPNVLEDDDLSVDPPRLGQFTPQWGGRARLRAANEKAHALGVRTGIIFSQRDWNMGTLTPELRQLAEKWVMRREAGDAVTEGGGHQHVGAGQWGGGEQTDYLGFRAHIMCNAVKDYQDFAIRNVLGVLGQGGYSGMFFDESTEEDLCFNPEHGHADVSAPSVGTYNFFKSLKAAMRNMNSSEILIGEGWDVVASQIYDLSWVWGSHEHMEVFRYTLPWVKVARAVSVDLDDANQHFVLGVHLAIVAKGLENGKNLSDFPEYAQHLGRLASLHEKTERFWIDGVFHDDLGLQISGALGKVYTLPNELALMVANLTAQPVEAGFELDSRRYGITTESYATISSSGTSGSAKAQKAGSLLKGSQPLASYEVVAVIFERKEGQG